MIYRYWAVTQGVFLWQVKMRALLTQVVYENILVSFLFKVEFLDYILLGDILLKLYDEHSCEKKYIYIGGNYRLTLLVASICFMLSKYCCYACEGFVLLFCS